MAKNAQFIYGGGADVTLYDATNGYYNLGYLADLKVSSVSKQAPTVRGQKMQFLSIYDLLAKQLQSNAALVLELTNRRTVDQTIYVTGGGKLYTLNGMAINYAWDNPYNESDPGTITLTARTAAEPTMQENLIGTDGKFEVDTNSDGLADGWVMTGLTSVSIVASHLSGGGNAQQIATPSTNAFIRHDTVAPFESPIKVSLSGYVKALAASNFKLMIQMLDASLTSIDSISEEITMTSGEETRQTLTGILNPGGNTCITLRAYFYYSTLGTANIQIDNAQLEFGDVKDFRDV